MIVMILNWEWKAAFKGLLCVEKIIQIETSLQAQSKERLYSSFLRTVRERTRAKLGQPRRTTKKQWIAWKEGYLEDFAGLAQITKSIEEELIERFDYFTKNLELFHI